MRRIAPGLRLGAVLALCLGACAAPGPGPLSADTPRRHRVEDVPFLAQQRDHCGPAALAMALGHAGSPADPEEIARQTVTPQRRGSFPFDVVGAARRRGHVPYPVTGWEDLLAEIAAGRPVIVLQNLGLSWIPFWHFAVLIGYDLDREQVTLHTGPRAARTIPLDLFARTWTRASRWARVVLPPDELPVLLPEPRTLEAIAALEQSAQWEVAARAYTAATRRWETSGTAHLGLGTTLYHTGDLEASERALRRAIELDPDSAPALNNLAHVVAELGRPDEARLLLEAHLDRAGPWRPVLLRTLEELEGR